MLKLYWGIYLIYQGMTQAPHVTSGCYLVDESKLIELIKEHEGVRAFPYVDSMGKLTIGAGRNLTDRGISISTIESMLAEDIALAKSELDKLYGNWCSLSNNRQMVLVSMMYNMGLPRYSTFKLFWAALEAGQWDRAADEMLDSRWRKQVKDRAVELASMMRKG